MGSSRLPACPLCGARVRVLDVIWGMVKCDKCFYLVTDQIHRALSAKVKPAKVLAKGSRNKTGCICQFTGDILYGCTLGHKYHCRRVLIVEDKP